MNVQATQSRQEYDFGTPILPQPLVKCHQLQGGRIRKGGQIGIAPNLGREGATLSGSAPMSFKLLRLVRERDSSIIHHGVVEPHACFNETASSGSAAGLVERRRKPCWVQRQKQHVSCELLYQLLAAA